MKFIALIYLDPPLLESLPPGKSDAMLRECFTHADDLQQQGSLLESRMLADPKTAKSIRIRNGRSTTLDGPFAETKEVLGGFNLIEAKDMDEALQIAAAFPWAATGCVEVRPVQDINEVRQRVGSPALPPSDPPR